jgi:sugar phosphate isomerase/epimerase
MFLKTGAVAFVASLPLAAAPVPVRAGGGGGTMGQPVRRLKTGVQLYSVRKLCDADLPGTLKALKGMGYEGVQCGGFYGRTAKELNALFRDHGLAAAGMQMQADRIIKPEDLPSSVEFARELGAPYLFVPWFDAKTADGWKRFAEQMSEAAQTFKAAGIRLGYHNHQHEFRDKFDGTCKWEILYDNASPDLCQQMDLGHCLLAGEDPARWLKKYPGRNPAVHVKAASDKTGVIGADGADWEKIFAACEADITEWYVVEAELRPDSLDDVRGCIEYMKKIGRA